MATRVAYFDRFRRMDTWFYAHTSEMPELGRFRCMFQKPYIPDTSGFNKNTRFRCIPKKNTSELHKNRQFRCIHPSKSINLSNPRCHIIPSEANLRANHSEIHQNSSKTPHINQIKHSRPPYPNFTYYLRVSGNLLYIPPLLSLLN